MVWNAAKFDKLVENTEKFACKNIRLYRLQVALFAILGYSYLFIIIIFLFSPLVLSTVIYSFNPNKNIWGWLCIIMMCLPIFPFILSTLVSFRVLFKNGLPPVGIYLNRTEFTKLFNLIDELTAKLKVPKLKYVLLTEDLNASVIQISKLGIFGWHENYLILGIPLMATLSYDEFRSVLAHEIGHLSGNHSRFNGWIFRLRETLAQMLEYMQRVNEGHPSIFVTPFVKWYIPFFDAYSFVLARTNEYDADKFALRIAGAENCALSLIKIELVNGFIKNKFWNHIYQQIEYQPKPPADAYTQLLKALSEPNTFKSNYDFLKKALARKTNNLDTHPCLTQSLKNLGYKSFPKSLLDKCISSQRSAAELLLGKKLPELVLNLDRRWQQQVEAFWWQRYAVTQEILQEIKVLSESACKTLNIEDDWKLACLYLEINRKELLLKQLYKIIERKPDYVDAHYLLGQFLLKEGNIEGVKHLEKALSLNINLTDESLKLLYQFFWQRGEVKKANRYRDRLDNFYYQLKQAEIERSEVTHKDKFLPHKLEKTEIIKINKQISQFSQIKEVYLVQKKVNYFSNIPIYIFAVVRKCPFLNLELEDGAYKLQITLKKQLEIPGNYEVLVVESRNHIVKQIREIQSSLIYTQK